MINISCKHQQFSEGVAKNFSSGPKRLAGVIVEVLGPLSYQIKVDDNRIIKRHVDHLFTCSEFKKPTLDDEVLSGPVFTQDNSPAVTNDTAVATHMSSPHDTVTSSQAAEHHYPQCQHRRKPERYQGGGSVENGQTLYSAHYVCISHVIMYSIATC